MMQAIRNQMLLAAQLAGGDVAESRAGIVRSYDPSTAAAKVEFVDRSQPENGAEPFLSGWLPVTSPWVGNGWGMDAPPSIGDQVEVKFFGGSIENGYVCGRLYSDADRPPGAPSGEFWLVHKAGQYLKLLNDGSIESHGQWLHKGAMVIEGTLLVEKTITGQGGMAISGDNGTGVTSTVTGDLDTTGTIKNNGKDIGSTHRHSNGNGGADTGTPI